MRLNLKEARKNKGLKQAEVAKHLGIATNSYQAIELGTRGTSEENWLKLFDLFGKKIPLNELMENTLPERQFGAVQKKPDGNQANNSHQNNTTEKDRL